MNLKQFKALISIDVLEGDGKSEFFLIVYAENSLKARSIAEAEYPSATIKFVVQTGTMAESFFKNHYSNYDEAEVSQKHQRKTPSFSPYEAGRRVEKYRESLKSDAVGVPFLNEKESENMNDSIQSNLRAIDTYASAIDIMKKLGGVVDSSNNNQIFCQVNAIKNPDAFDKIISMTRDLVHHQNTEDIVGFKFLFFEMK